MMAFVLFISLMVLSFALTEKRKWLSGAVISWGCACMFAFALPKLSNPKPDAGAQLVFAITATTILCLGRLAVLDVWRSWKQRLRPSAEGELAGS